MPKKALRHWLSLSLCLALLLSNLLWASPIAAQRNARATAQPRKVRLVLGIVIDQFGYDYLTRFEDLFGEGGFRRLLREGAVFTNANYLYTPTVTACGHATFMSGSVPSLHGIIANEWYDRETGKRVTSVTDGGVKLLGGKGSEPGFSPRRLIGSTLGDQLRLSTNGQAKVVGIAVKDRSAILPAGKHPNGAYWFDTNLGTFVSSNYYFNDLPEWVKKFNQTYPADRYFGAKWERLLPESAYRRSAPDDSPYEVSPYGNKFPYTVNGGETKPGPKFYDQFTKTPFANDYTVAFAKAAIESEGLGQDDQPDLLTVSFSANDLLGHIYGPYSQEVEDMTLRTDRVLADLLSYIDQRIGLQNTIVVLTADHAVAPIPEQSQDLGLGGRIEEKAITEAIQTALAQRFGDEKWVLGFYYGNAYLDLQAVERRRANLAEVERAASEAVVKIPGIAECFTRSQILSGQLPLTMVARSVAEGFNAQRNGNLVVVPKPFFLWGDSRTTHGTPYSYDTHVPVIFYGAGIAAGHYLTACSPADIAPTLSALLRIDPPSSTVGRILIEAINSNSKP